MRAHVSPSSLGGAIPAVASKSMAHRLMILCAQVPGGCELACATSSEDIEATRRCLEALRGPAGSDGLVTLDVGESGSTLRFLLPLAGALARPARFVRRGRLASRPLAPFDAQLEAHGMRIRAVGDDLVTGGRLRGGRFELPGDVSSQFVSGLLLSSPSVGEPMEVLLTSSLESRPYVALTVHALAGFGVSCGICRAPAGGGTPERYVIDDAVLVSPGRVEVEGDWSNAAFWLAAGALEQEGVTVTGLDLASPQGDRSVLAALSAFGARIARRGDAARATRDRARAASFDVSSIPDLVPPLAAVAATSPGVTRLLNAGRLRLKESDRLATVSSAVLCLGGRAHVDGDDLVVEGVGQLVGGTVDAANDHRIAMMAAVMATHARGDVTIEGADCVAKSYPGFWDDYRALGGDVRLEA